MLYNCIVSFHCFKKISIITGMGNFRLVSWKIEDAKMCTILCFSCINLVWHILVAFVCATAFIFIFSLYLDSDYYVIFFIIINFMYFRF